MKILLPALQITLSLLLILFILLQAKGTGLGSAWGGTGEFYRSKRGVEKLLFYATIGLIILFFVSSVAGIIIRP